MSFIIKEITAEKTWSIRHQVMWPNRSLDYVKLSKDDEGLHYGLFQNEGLLSVISLFVDGNTAQFRKFATLETAQGKGYGTKLLQHLIQQAKTLGIELIWCNARKKKTRFYHKFGLQETEREFIKSGIEYVVMERKF